MLEQASQLINKGSVTTVRGHILALDADTLCVHGDNTEAVQAIKDIRQIIDG
jgi:UPF0271 protein